jgi:hypothetical protein
VVWASRFASFVRRIFHRREVEEYLDTEIAVHFELLAERYVAQGMSLEAARHKVRVQFGAPDQAKQNVRQGRMGTGIETALQDIRYATETAPQPWFRYRARPHNRSGHRGEHCDFQRGGRGAASSSFLSRRRTAGIRL